MTVWEFLERAEFELYVEANGPYPFSLHVAGMVIRGFIKPGRGRDLAKRIPNSEYRMDKARNNNRYESRRLDWRTEFDLARWILNNYGRRAVITEQLTVRG